METNPIASTLPQQIAADGSPVTARATASKYGAVRMARYLLRSFDDCIDVCETINHQVQERVERDDIEAVFREIECWAMAVPNTVSNIIVGFGIPSLILEDRQTTTHPIRPLQLDFSKSPEPAVKRTPKALVMAHDVKSFFDLNAFNHYLRNPEGLKAQGLELATMRKTMKMMIKKRDGVKANFALILTCTVESDDQKSAG
ncbi:MAG: hypothetical protein NT028_08125 [candidate division Zixibacteria bacterium]|nr:hypothetical protein [candidate division Zixibacteria bacterium]